MPGQPRSLYFQTKIQYIIQAVCWYYAKDLYDETHVPQGIVSSNWGGTFIQSWMDNATNAKCMLARDAAPALPVWAHIAATQHPVPTDVRPPRERPGAFQTKGFVNSGPDPNIGHGVLFNSMIFPFAVGPMMLTSFIWFQGTTKFCTCSVCVCACVCVKERERERAREKQRQGHGAEADEHTHRKMQTHTRACTCTHTHACTSYTM